MGKMMAATIMAAAICLFGVSTVLAQGPARMPAWGVGARVGTFGVPNQIVDQFLEEHPDIKGNLYGAEIRYYGDGGPKGAFSLGLAVDQGTTSADGTWRKDPEDEAVVARGELDLLAVTLTAYWDMFASSPFHPFIGIGLGYAHMSGSYRESDTEIGITEDLPAIHLPLGLVVQLGKYITARAEARVINGFSFGGQLMINF